MDTEQFFNHSGQANPWEARKARAKFGVKNLGGIQADFAQTIQVLARCMKNPLFAGNYVIKFSEGADGWWVKQKRSGAPTKDLYQIGALRIGKS